VKGEKTAGEKPQSQYRTEKGKEHVASFQEKGGKKVTQNEGIRSDLQKRRANAYRERRNRQRGESSRGSSSTSCLRRKKIHFQACKKKKRKGGSYYCEFTGGEKNTK